MASNPSVPNFSINNESQISVGANPTNAAITNQGYTYNQAGFTYNQAGVDYGGVHDSNSDNIPLSLSADKENLGFPLSFSEVP